LSLNVLVQLVKTFFKPRELKTLFDVALMTESTVLGSGNVMYINK